MEFSLFRSKCVDMSLSNVDVCCLLQAAVLQQSVNHVYTCAMISFFCVGIAAFFIYIRNNTR
jgi:hypothetical protein